MALSAGIIEIDLHGMRAEEAVRAVKREVSKAPASVYIIRAIHGYHGGTALRDRIREEYGSGGNPKVKRVEAGSNPGITELVLREY